MKVKFNHILCTTDLSDFSNQAALRAVHLAKAFEAKIYLCHIIDVTPVSMHGASFVFDEEHVQTIKEETFNKLESLMSGVDVKWDPIVETGPVATTISKVVKEIQADLAIVATHGRSGFKKLFLGSVTEKLLRTIPCPLLIIPPYEKHMDMEDSQFIKYKNIVVGCDFSDDSQWAVEYGLSLAQEFESSIHLIHVMEPFVYRDKLLPDAILDSTWTEYKERSLEQLKSIPSGEVYDWCDVKINCLSGKPFEAITQYANENTADLVVLGVRGHGLVETLLLGSTTDRVIRKVSCPVLSVCSPEMK